METEMNILWFCTDQQRFDTLGCYGNEFVNTPNIDRLASMGVKFNRAYCQSPVCAPSRASFLTGRYPRTCSVRQNGQNINKDERLVSKILKDNGYTCGLAGKLHLSACHPSVCKTQERRIDDGYDCFNWSHHPWDIDKSANWPMNEYTMWLNSKNIKFETPVLNDCKYVKKGMPEEYHQTKWCVDKAIEFIESAKSYDLPWMFSLNTFDPHHEFDPPEEYLSRYLSHLDRLPLPNYKERELDNKTVFQKKDHEGSYDTVGNYQYDEMIASDHRYIKASYYAMIDLIDHQFGRLLDYLEQSGQLNNTMIIFTSDHGESLGDHGIYLKGPYFYEGNTHVPLIISYPDKIVGGKESNALVELVDLAPTICDFAGLSYQSQMQGRTLLPLLTEQNSEECHRESIYCEYYNANINHRDPLAFLTMVFDGRYKLVKTHGDGIACELYDLLDDPTETTNRYYDSDFDKIKISMLELMCDRMAQTVDPMPQRLAYW